MKLSEFKNEAALDLLADIIEPVSHILADKRCSELLKKRNIPKAVKVILKQHKNEVIEVMAALDGKTVEEYECNVFTLPMKLLELLNDPELLAFFASQGQETK